MLWVVVSWFVLRLCFGCCGVSPSGFDVRCAVQCDAMQQIHVLGGLGRCDPTISGARARGICFDRRCIVLDVATAFAVAHRTVCGGARPVSAVFSTEYKPARNSIAFLIVCGKWWDVL